MAQKPFRQMGRATLQEVAERAGVSSTTASLVLSGKALNRRISQDAHERVQRAAIELNYAPNLLVRSLRRGRTHVVSFYNSFRQRKAQDLYLDKLASGVEHAADTYGYDVLVHCNFARDPVETYQFLNGGFADGLMMFAPLTDDPLVSLLRKSNLPVVLLNTRDPDGQFPSVVDDGRMGLRSVADTLVDLGHRRIAIFTRSGPDVRDADSRVEMLRTYLAERDVHVPQKRVIDFGEDRVGLLRELLQQSDPPTAIFCWHDHTAYQALEACEELGVSVPEKLSIVGYDGIRWPAATSHTAASVKVDLDLLAIRGMRLLDVYIEGYDGPLIEEDLPVAFSPGTTLAPAPRP